MKQERGNFVVKRAIVLFGEIMLYAGFSALCILQWAVTHTQACRSIAKMVLSIIG